MELNDILNFLGLRNQAQLNELLNNNFDRVRYEVFSKTNIQAYVKEDLNFKELSTFLFGFTLVYPVKFNKSQFLVEKNAASKIDLSFMHQDIRHVFGRRLVDIVLLSVNYDTNKKEVQYNFLVKGIDKKTDELLKILAL